MMAMNQTNDKTKPGLRDETDAPSEVSGQGADADQTKTKSRRRLFTIGRPWWYVVGMAVISAWLLFATLWGIKAPFIWGHYGYHAGFHGCNARTLLRHHIWTPAQYAGRGLPPARTYYLHHPILMHPYLAVGFSLFGEHEWVVRAVPVTFTFLALFALAWVVRRLYGPGPALAAAAVFSLLPQNLVFSHLIDHETPGVFYSILATGAFVLWLEKGRWKHGVVALIAAGLAGLTDWPPYPIFFFMAIYGLGRASALAPGRKSASRFLPFGLTGLLVQVLPAAGAYYAFDHFLKLPDRLCLGLTAGMVGLVTLGLRSSDPDMPKPGKDTDGPWGRLRPALIITGRLALWSLVILAAIGFHVWYTKHVGAWDDLTKAFKHRSGGSIGKGFLKHYKEGILYLMFTKPVVWAGVAWLAVLPFRMLSKEKLSGRQAIPLAFVAAQLLHNFKFPNEIDMHNYRAYYFVGFFSFVAADWAWLSGSMAHRALSWAKTQCKVSWLQWSRRLPAWSATVPAAALMVGLIGWEAKTAWKPYRKSRSMGGTLTFKHYRSYRHEIRFFGRVNAHTNPQTFVLIHRSFHPRFEDLFYLDRDYGKVTNIPLDAKSAHRRARTLYWNPYRPRRHLAWWAQKLPWRIRKKMMPPAGKMPPFSRKVVVVADLRNKKALRAFARLAKKHPVVIYHPFGLAYYDRKGHDIEVHRITAKPVSGLERYLTWRSHKIIFPRDRGLETWYKKRFERIASQPMVSPRPQRARRTKRLRHPVRGQTDEHLDELARWLDDQLGLDHGQAAKKRKTPPKAGMRQGPRRSYQRPRKESGQTGHDDGK